MMMFSSLQGPVPKSNKSQVIGQEDEILLQEIPRV